MEPASNQHPADRIWNLGVLHYATTMPRDTWTRYVPQNTGLQTPDHNQHGNADHGTMTTHKAPMFHRLCETELFVSSAWRNAGAILDSTSCKTVSECQLLLQIRRQHWLGSWEDNVLGERLLRTQPQWTFNGNVHAGFKQPLGIRDRQTLDLIHPRITGHYELHTVQPQHRVTHPEMNPESKPRNGCQLRTNKRSHGTTHSSTPPQYILSAISACKEKGKPTLGVECPLH